MAEVGNNNNIAIAINIIVAQNFEVLAAVLHDIFGFQSLFSRCPHAANKNPRWQAIKEALT
jgi:hypothetical protein